LQGQSFLSQIVLSHQEKNLGFFSASIYSSTPVILLIGS
jgi:hypothetical protein